MNQLSLQGIKLITFDVTGTLLKFRKPPVQVYVEFAAKANLNLDDDTVKKNFKEQWKKMNDLEPHFGKCWETWWTKFVVNTLKSSDPDRFTPETVYKRIAVELIDHFNTNECWEIKEGARDLLQIFADRREKSSDKNSIASIFSSRKLEYPKHPVIGVVSNFDPRLHNILKLVNIRRSFAFCLTSFDVQCSKPSPQMFHWAMQAWKLHHGDTISNTKLSPDEALHIGNSYLYDYIGATSAGWNAALVLSPEEEETEIPKKYARRDCSKDPPLIIFKDLLELKSFFENNLEEMCYT